MFFAEEANAYGDEWGKQFKGDEDATPTVSEIIEGLVSWLVNQTE